MGVWHDCTEMVQNLSEKQYFVLHGVRFWEKIGHGLPYNVWHGSGSYVYFQHVLPYTITRWCSIQEDITTNKDKTARGLLSEPYNNEVILPDILNRIAIKSE